MKKRKFSLLLNIATICLCVCAIAIGVYSAKTASLSISGSIGFEAHNCEVKVLGSVSGANETVAPYQETDGTGKEVSGDSETWAVGDITFDDLNCSNDEIATPIVFTFKMKNMSAYDVAAEIKLVGDLATKIKSSVEYTSTADSYSAYSGYVCVLPQTASGSTAVKVTAKVTLSPVTDQGFETAIDLSNFSISFAKPVDATATDTSNQYEYNNMCFTVDETTKTAKVRGNSVSGDVVIPSAIIAGEEMYIVTTLGGDTIDDYQAFGSSSLKSVTIPASVTSIGLHVFDGCGNLTSVAIPNSVTSIGSHAFYCCYSLTSITIPNSVTSIGGNAFYSCWNLASIIIPCSITSIGEQAFSYCVSLVSITVDSGNTVYDSRNYCNAIIEKATNTLISGCKYTTIPSSVTSIGKYAFYHCVDLGVIIIPSSVTSIGYDAFGLCGSFTINFQGTKEQWSANINSYSIYDHPDCNFTVHCTDGDIVVAINVGS